MTAEVFLDTNVLLYACSSSPDDASKQATASALIAESRFGLSTQVLQEFIANALRKPELGITEDVMDALFEMSGFIPVLPVTLELLLSATTLRRRYQLSHWDATILATAMELECHTLYSEDFTHGQRFENLTIRNPFQ